MNVAIQIFYVSNGNEILQRNSVQRRGKSDEQLAFEWWKEIKRYMPYGGTLQKVIVNGEDISEKVMELENAPLV